MSPEAKAPMRKYLMAASLERRSLRVNPTSTKELTLTISRAMSAIRKSEADARNRRPTVEINSNPK